MREPHLSSLRRSAVAVASMAAALGAGGPALADVRSAFQTLCIATDGREDRIEAAAVESDWQPAPDNVLARYRSADASVVGFVHVVPGAGPGDVVVLTTKNELQMQAGVPVRMSVCRAQGAAAPTLEADLSAQLGPGVRTPEGLRWAFTKSDGQIVPQPGLLEGGDGRRGQLIAQGAIYEATLSPGSGGRATLQLTTWRRPGS